MVAELTGWLAWAGTWMAAHPASVAALLAAASSALAAAAALAAWRSARRARTVGGRACEHLVAQARTLAELRAALDRLDGDVAAITNRTAGASQLATLAEAERTRMTDLGARLDALDQALEQLRADVIDQQTAKYRINEAIRQAMQR